MPVGASGRCAPARIASVLPEKCRSPWTEQSAENTKAVRHTPNRLIAYSLSLRRQLPAQELEVLILIANLRKKLEDDSSKPHYVQTVRGAGYRFRRP